MGSFSLQCLMSLGFRVYLLWLNKQKVREEQIAQDEQEDSATHAFADLTDKKVKNVLESSSINILTMFRITCSDIRTKLQDA